MTNYWKDKECKLNKKIEKVKIFKNGPFAGYLNCSEEDERK